MGASLRMEPADGDADGQASPRLRRRPRLGRLAQVSVLSRARRVPAQSEHGIVRRLSHHEKW